MSVTTNPNPPSESALMPEDPDEQLEESEEHEEDADLQSTFIWYRAAPAWLISTLVHLLILLILGLVTLTDPTKIINVLSASNNSEDGPEIEEFMIEEIDPGEVSEMEEVAEPVDVQEMIEVVEPTPVEPMEIATVPLELSDFAEQMAPSAASLQTLGFGFDAADE